MQPKDKLLFGASFSDHMLEVDWDSETGWGTPLIRPYGNFSISPACSVFHYAIECFEGMKAYKDAKGNIRMFRPDMNMKRMNSSTSRLLLPNFDGEEYTKLQMELLKTDERWIPEGRGYSLYLRPTMISTHQYIGVQAPKKAKLFTICSPVGPYYPTGFAPVKLLADPRYVRAWPGGVGDIKCGGNYAMSIKAGQEAMAKGYAQMLWLYGADHEVTEVGTMNQFWFWINKQGEKELITAPLDGTILPGVTRDSIIQMCREKGEFKVTERTYTINELCEAVNENRIIEAFGAGTAAIVSPVEGFHYDEADYPIPLDPLKPELLCGALTHWIAETLMDIQYGVTEHPWSVVVK